MKKIVVASLTALIGFSGAAIAADMPTKAPILSKAPVSLWDGFYVGVHGGYASGDADVFIIAPASSSPKGGFGGFQLGYNYMLTPNWLLGAEIDASFGDIDDNIPPLAASNFKVGSFGTIRGRLGYAFGPWLLYGTAGTAWARTEETLGGGLFRTDRTQVGWTGGVGVEYAFARNWSAKAEYLYADFGDARRSVPIVGQVNNDLTLNMIRVGLNYRFGGFDGVAQTPAMSFKAPAQTVTGWTGAYIGLHGGFGSGDLRSSIPGIGATNLDPDGGFGGIQTGYNWQFAPNWVIGLETDSSWGALKDSGGGNSAEIDQMASARGRFGYAVSNLMIYGTGGLALAHLESTTGGGAVTFDQYLLGWTAGAGVEYKFAPKWSAKVEYAYMDFGKVRETLGPLSFDDKLDVHTVKVGLNYHASLFGLLFR